MKILHVVRQFYPVIGGLENYILNLAKEQVNNGYSVSVVTLNRSFPDNKKLLKQETVFNIDITRIPYLGSKRYPIAFSVFKYLKDFDIVHVHAVDFFSDFLALTKLFHKKKLILTTHGGYFHTKKNIWLKKIFFNTVTRVTIKKYKVVIACSKNDYSTFSKISDKVTLIYNGVDVDKYINILKTPKKGHLITVGRIDSHKGIDKLIYVVRKLKEKGIEAKLEIIGPDSRNLLSALKKLTEDLKLENNIIFRGKLSNDELIEAYSSAYLFISASEYEGFGIAAVEALASGTPCILSNIPSFIEIIDSNEFGRIVDFNNTDEVIRNIDFFLNLNTAQYDELTLMSRKFASNFNWIKVAKKINGLY